MAPASAQPKEWLIARLAEFHGVLAEMGSDFTGLAARVAELSDRYDQGRFRLAVLGQFKRGKSSLLNALLGEPLLPTGVLPLTAIPTLLRYGPERRVRVIRLNGQQEEHVGTADALTQVLTRFVTERENPANRLGVAQVEVDHPSALLANGVEIIDTPGIGSTLPHNTEMARHVLPVCDGALFILSPDPPITEIELQFLRLVKEAVARVVFVLTKADLLPTPERAEVLAFLQRVLHEQAGFRAEERIFTISARQALEARATASAPLLSASGITALETYLADFLVTDKHAALQEAVRTKAARMIGEALFALDLQRRVIDLPREDLERRAARFDAHLETMERERVYFHDRLAGDRQRLLAELDRLADALVEPATKALSACVETVRGETGLGTAGAELPRRISALLAEEVDRVFGQAARELSAAVASRFHAVQDLHCRELEHLIDRVRRTAADLFEVPCLDTAAVDRLETVREPRVISQRWVTSFTEEAGVWITWLLPRRLRAKRFDRRLRETIAYLVRRNVEEVRWATRQNLEETFRQFEARMDAQLDAAIGHIRTAVRAALERQARREAAGLPELERLKGFRPRLTQLLAELSPPGKATSYGSPL